MLEMGESIRIAELAERMIRLHGLRPEVDIQIEFTGLRPGEKLHEELMENEESREATNHAQIYRVLSGRRKSNKLDLALLEQWVYSALDLPENDLEKNLRSYSSDGVINQPNSYKRK